MDNQNIVEIVKGKFSNMNLKVNVEIEENIIKIIVPLANISKENIIKITREEIDLKNCVLENDDLLISINFEEYYNEVKIKELIDNQLKIFNYQDIPSRTISDIKNIETEEFERLTEDSVEKLKDIVNFKKTIDPTN